MKHASKPLMRSILLLYVLDNVFPDSLRGIVSWFVLAGVIISIIFVPLLTTCFFFSLLLHRRRRLPAALRCGHLIVTSRLPMNKFTRKKTRSIYMWTKIEERNRDADEGTKIIIIFYRFFDHDMAHGAR